MGTESCALYWALCWALKTMMSTISWALYDEHYIMRTVWWDALYHEHCMMSTISCALYWALNTMRALLKWNETNKTCAPLNNKTKLRLIYLDLLSLLFPFGEWFIPFYWVIYSLFKWGLTHAAPIEFDWNWIRLKESWRMKPMSLDVYVMSLDVYVMSLGAWSSRALMYMSWALMYMSGRISPIPIWKLLQSFCTSVLQYIAVCCSM